VTVHLPPLRERRSDIPLLAEYFIEKFCGQSQRSVKELSPEVHDAMMHYPWPGNVRELENAIHTAVVLAKENTLQLSEFPVFTENGDAPGLDFDQINNDYYNLFTTLLDPIFGRIVANSEGRIYNDLLAALERSMINAALRATSNNQVQAAQTLGISRNTLRDRMKRYGIL
jgi:DNA-binding NtrC family response regulator